MFRVEDGSKASLEIRGSSAYFAHGKRLLLTDKNFAFTRELNFFLNA